MRMTTLFLATVLATPASYAAMLTLTSGLTLDRTTLANLITNGSFENGGPGIYWATGTTRTPYSPLPGWVSSGGPNNYAFWGDTALNQGGQGSAPLPEGTHGVYFGNGAPASVSPTPMFNSDGTVTFSSSPLITPASLFSPPVTLSQTVSLSTTDLYGLSFWTSGEGIDPANHDGIFGLDITGFPTLYLTVPSGAGGGLGTSHVYEFLLQPVVAATTITFTNWGHFGPGQFTTELVMDDVILNAVPEPSIVALISIGILALLGIGLRQPGKVGKGVALPTKPPNE